MSSFLIAPPEGKYGILFVLFWNFEIFKRIDFFGHATAIKIQTPVLATLSSTASRVVQNKTTLHCWNIFE